MPVVDTEIIVLRTLTFSESSQIIEAISPEFGRLNLIAKGVRKILKNPVGAPFDTLCYAGIQFYTKRNEALETVSSNQIYSYFPAMRKNLSSWYAGTLLIEITRSIVHPRNPDPELFAFRTEIIS